MRYLTKTQTFTLVLAIVYILSPIDLIPELIAGPFGLVDDVAAFGVIISLLLSAKLTAANAKTRQTYVTVDPMTGNVTN
ncbi:MAG: YkvA family protein [Candidatus Nanopelagicales bacterium]